MNDATSIPGAGDESADPPLSIPSLGLSPGQALGGSASHKGGEGKDAPAGAVAEPPDRIVPNKNRRLQVAPTRRKLFTPAMKATFLEWLAATGNVCLSARKTGIHYRTALRHRIEDAAFADGWARSLGQAVARLEAKLLETRPLREAPIALDGDWEAPEMEEVDPWLVLQLIREQRRSLYGPRRPGRRPYRLASNAEVRAQLVKRLALFGVRVAAEAERDPRDAPGAREPGACPYCGRSGSAAAG